MPSIVFRKRNKRSIARNDEPLSQQSGRRSVSMGAGAGVGVGVGVDGNDNDNDNDNVSGNDVHHSPMIHTNCCSSSFSNNKKGTMIIIFYGAVLLGIFTVSFLLVPSPVPASGSTLKSTKSLSRDGVVVFHTVSEQMIHSNTGRTATVSATDMSMLQNLYNEDILKTVYSPIFKSGNDVDEIHERHTFTYEYPTTRSDTETGKLITATATENENTKIETKTFVMNVSYPKYDLQDILHDYDEEVTIGSNNNNNYNINSLKSLRQVYDQSKKGRQGATVQLRPRHGNKQQQSFNSKSKTASNDTNNHNNSSSSSSSSNSNNKNGVILTRRGYKGGPIHYQTNQDRAIIIKPFPFYDRIVHANPDGSIDNHNDNHIENDNEDGSSNLSFSMFIGIFDGHSDNGHLVANFVQQYLPKALSINLSSVAIQIRDEGGVKDDAALEVKKQNENKIKGAIMQSFKTVDDTIPHDIATEAGCTASSILQLDHETIYTANVGDSTSFIIAYHRSTRRVDVIYETKKHKPDMKVERERIERMGGMVEIPPVKEQVVNGVRMDNTSRVVVPKSGIGSVSLAMSRSLGDRDGRSVGVISEPTIEILNIKSLMIKAKRQSGISSTKEEEKIGNIELFAVVASDGLLDFLEPSVVAQRLGPRLYSMNMMYNEEMLKQACEELILEASSKWLRLGFHYRDDITIAISRIDHV